MTAAKVVRWLVVELAGRPRGFRFLCWLADRRPMRFHERQFMRYCWRMTSNDRTRLKLEARRA